MVVQRRKATVPKKPAKPKHGGGMPAYQRSEETANCVAALVCCGQSHENIRKILGIGLTTLKKYYRNELENGAEIANGLVQMQIYKRAMSDGRDGLVAGIFWLKCRCGWNDRQIIEVGIKRDINEYTIEELNQIIANEAAGSRGRKAPQASGDEPRELH